MVITYNLQFQFNLIKLNTLSLQYLLFMIFFNLSIHKTHL
jgi:hypothetical protein